MKLKDKKIELCQPQYVMDAYGNRRKMLVTVATVWAYFRQMSMQELYGTVTQVQEEALFQIGYRDDLATDFVIRYKGVEYEIVKIDVFEGYKGDLVIYCKNTLR